MRNPLPEWFLGKLVAKLTTHDGCTVEERPEGTLQGSRATVVDVFGFRYEINIKLIGRIQKDVETGTSESKGA